MASVRLEGSRGKEPLPPRLLARLCARRDGTGEAARTTPGGGARGAGAGLSRGGWTCPRPGPSPAMEVPGAGQQEPGAAAAPGQEIDLSLGEISAPGEGSGAAGCPRLGTDQEGERGEAAAKTPLDCPSAARGEPHGAGGVGESREVPSGGAPAPPSPPPFPHCQTRAKLTPIPKTGTSANPNLPPPAAVLPLHFSASSRLLQACPGAQVSPPPTPQRGIWDLCCPSPFQAPRTRNRAGALPAPLWRGMSQAAKHFPGMGSAGHIHALLKSAGWK